MARENIFTKVNVDTTPIDFSNTARMSKEVFTNLSDLFGSYHKKAQADNLAKLTANLEQQKLTGTIDPTSFTSGIDLIEDPTKKAEFLGSVNLAKQTQDIGMFDSALNQAQRTGDFTKAEGLIQGVTNPLEREKLLGRLNTLSDTNTLNRYLLNAQEAASAGNIDEVLPTLQNVGSHLSFLPPELQEQAFTKVQALRPIVEQRFGEKTARDIFGQYFEQEQAATGVLKNTAADVYKGMGQSPLMQFTGMDLVPAPITEEMRTAYAKAKGYDLNTKKPDDIDKEITTEQDKLRKGFATSMLAKSKEINPPDVNQALRNLNNKLLQYGIQPTGARDTFEALRDARKILTPEDKASVDTGTKQLERAHALSLERVNKEYSFLSKFNNADVDRITKSGVTDADLDKMISSFDPSWQLASFDQDDQAEIRDKVYEVKSKWVEKGLARAPSNGELISALYRIKDSAAGSDGITGNMDRILPALKDIIQENALNPPKDKDEITKDFKGILDNYFKETKRADNVRDVGLANLMATASARSGNVDVAQTLAGFQRVLGNYAESSEAGTNPTSTGNTGTTNKPTTLTSSGTAATSVKGTTAVTLDEITKAEKALKDAINTPGRRSKIAQQKRVQELTDKLNTLRKEHEKKTVNNIDSTVIYDDKEYSINKIMDAIAFAETGTVPEAELATVRGEGKITGGVGKYQVLRSTAIQPGFGVKNIFQLADEQDIKYSGKRLEDARTLLEIPALNKEFAYGYMQGLIKEFGPEKALRFYRDLEKAKKDTAYFARFNESLKGK